MSGKARKWISIVSDAKEGESSEKRVVSSNFKHIRSIGVDDSGTRSTKISYKVRGIWRDIFTYNGTAFDTLKIPDAGRMQIEGAPEIPQEGLFVAIPENAEVKEVKIINKKENKLTGEYYVLPASKPILEGEEPEYIPKKEIYESDESFPGKDIEFMGTKHVAGRKVAHIIVNLVQYKPKSKKVKALESIDLEVVYETRLGMDAKVKRRLLRKSPMEQMILDSESIIEGEKQKEKTEKESDLDSSGLHDPNNKGEYLIITTADLKDSVSTLALAKENFYTVKIVTKEEILVEFENPNEVEAIREFLIYTTENWAEPPEWVVLAGDVDKIPTYVTYYTTSGHTSDDLASDHYYADLSDNLAPEIVVSRLPVSNAQDMERICSRAASYGENGGAWRDNIFLTAYQSYGYINCKDDIASLIGTNFKVIKKYAGQSSKQEVIDTLNAGVVIANYRGHGSKTAWSASNGLNTNDVRNLNNNDKIPIVFSIACLNNFLDMAGECFGETWIRNEKAIAFLGASRPSFTSPNHDFDEYLFDAIINQGLTKVGDIVNWAKIKLFMNYTGSLAEDNIRMYLLLGEPTVDLVIEGGIEPISLNVPVSYNLPEKGSIKEYVIKGIESNKKLTINLDGPEGQDFDLYVKYGERATTTYFDFKKTSSSPDEEITIDSTRDGDYYIMVSSYRGSGSFTLNAQYENPIKTLILDEPVSSTIPEEKGIEEYVLERIESGRKLIIQLQGPEGQDFDLYVKYGERATTTYFDFKKTSSFPDEEITIDPTREGDYYILVSSYRGSGSFTLNAQYENGIKTLILDEPVSSTIPEEKGIEEYVLKRIESGRKITILLRGPEDQDFDLYVKFGDRAKIHDYDYKSNRLTANEEIIIDSTQQGDYYLMVYASGGSGPFCIEASTKPGNINVLYPNGGEVWEKGKTYNIRWESQSVGNDVKIMLESETGGQIMISDSAPNIGNFQYTVPYTLANEQYKVMVMSLNNSIQDVSDEVFSITHGICAVPIYDQHKWNDNPNIKWHNNCYNYACDRILFNDKSQPGRASGHVLNLYKCNEVTNASISDGLLKKEGSEPLEICYHKVALFVCPGIDYHWYRQDDNLQWSHKPGRSNAMNVDESGNIITDPRTANRGRYTKFCGFFWVCQQKITID